MPQICGRDAPVRHGYSERLHLHQSAWAQWTVEIRNWQAAGISKEKLFHALTIDNARVLHLDVRIGTVQRGKVANLLLLRANPLVEWSILEDEQDIRVNPELQVANGQQNAW